MVPTPFRGPTSQTRNIRSLSHDIKPFLTNLIFQYKNPLPFETEARSILTIPLLREHLDSQLFYIRYKTCSYSSSNINSNHI